MDKTSLNTAHFDGHAETYDQDLERALSVSGHDKDYFARGRLNWLAGCLQELNAVVDSVLDYGCGPGSTVPSLVEILGAGKVTGVDVSLKCLEVAKRNLRSDKFRFLPIDQYEPDGQVDLAYTNGVFHHIRPSERAGAVGYVYRALRPGGLFSFWENNPWNPGTRFIMSRCAFDDDAITLSAPESRKLLRAGGFEVVRADFVFVFPKVLESLRGLERFVSSLPFGAQYQILCRKPC